MYSQTSVHLPISASVTIHASLTSPSSLSPPPPPSPLGSRNNTTNFPATAAQPPTVTTNPTIVLLHYWGGSHRTFSRVITHLAPTYATAALDLRGWGESTGPLSDHDDDIDGGKTAEDGRRAYSIAAQASDVEAAIAALGLEDVVLVGLSMGAKVGMAVAGRLANRTSYAASSSSSTSRGGVGVCQSDFRLRGLALLSPAPPGPMALPEAEMREQQARAYDDAETAGFVARNVLTAPGSGNVVEADVEMLVGDMLRGNEWARRGWLEYGMGEDLRGLLGLIDWSDEGFKAGINVETSADVERATRGVFRGLPVLVVAAEKDIVEPVEKVRQEVYNVLAGVGDEAATVVEFKVVPGSGHLSPIERPREIAEILVEFSQRASGV